MKTTNSIARRKIGIIVIPTLIVLSYLMLPSCFGKQNSTAADRLENKQDAPFFITDSLVDNFDSIKRIVYLGYTENVNDTSKRNDVLKVYHLRGKDTILRNTIDFMRMKFERILLLSDTSKIPDETVDKQAFIVYSTISDDSFFSENMFVLYPPANRYEFVKRTNYMYHFYKPDTVAVKTPFLIKNRVEIDSTEMNSIFRVEYDLFCGKYPSISEWILAKDKK